MPKKRVFIDSSVIIRGFLYKKSNSSIVIEMANRGDIVGVINEKVVTEVLDVLKALKDKDFASLAFSLLYSSFEIVPKARYANEMELNKGKIKEKDLEHLATAKALNLPIIAYDRDFEGIEDLAVHFRNFLSLCFPDNSFGCQYFFEFRYNNSC
jgi:predicted nucleic acid-binding protein